MTVDFFTQQRAARLGKVADPAEPIERNTAKPSGKGQGEANAGDFADQCLVTTATTLPPVKSVSIREIATSVPIVDDNGETNEPLTSNLNPFSPYHPNVPEIVPTSVTHQ